MYEFLKNKLSIIYDNNEINDIIKGLNVVKKTTLRVNKLKSNYDEIEKEFNSIGIEFDKISDYPDAFILKNCKNDNGHIIDCKSNIIIEELDIYKQGKIYLQSLSSMKPVYVLEPKEHENILDMCAAPGSKTTFIQSLTNNKVNLTALELHKERFERLNYNIKLQGANVYTININANDLDNNFKFDKILIDAPCSGSGTLDLNNNKYEKYFTDKLINKCVSTQKKLVSKAYKLLNYGGIVVYSTCSLLKDENEEILQFALKNGFELVSEPIKIFPDENFEGFYICKLMKEKE